MSDINAELVLYRLDELRDDLKDIKDALSLHILSASERDVKIEQRVSVLERAREVANGSAGRIGGVTGGVVGAVAIILTYMIEWIRGRLGA